MATLHRTVVRPIVTEKTSAAYQAKGEYVFEVANDATKPAIKQAIEKLFGVKVTGVNTLNRAGKRVRTRAGFGHRAASKRAVVTVAEGDRIDIFGGPVS